MNKEKFKLKLVESISNRAEFKSLHVKSRFQQNRVQSINGLFDLLRKCNDQEKIMIIDYITSTMENTDSLVEEFVCAHVETLENETV